MESRNPRSDGRAAGATSPNNLVRSFFTMFSGLLIALPAHRYSRSSTVFVPAFALMCVYVAADLLRRRDSPLLHAVAFELAHLSWLVAVGVQFRLVGLLWLDVLIGALLLVWFTTAKRRAAGLFLVVVNGVGIFRILRHIVTATAAIAIILPLFDSILRLASMIAVGAAQRRMGGNSGTNSAVLAAQMFPGHKRDDTSLE